MADDLRLEGELLAGHNPNGTWALIVERFGDTFKVGIAGGASTDQFTVGNRGADQLEFIIGEAAIYLKGPIATATSESWYGQASMVFAASDWNDGEARDRNGVIAFRPDDEGSAYLVLEAPGNEMVHIFKRGLIRVNQWEEYDGLGDIIEGRKVLRQGQPFVALGHDNLRWGEGDESPPDVRIRRTGPASLSIDDAEGGQADVEVASLSLTKTSQPAASAQYVGQIRYIESPAGKGRFVGCVRNGTGYEWRRLDVL